MGAACLAATKFSFTDPKVMIATGSLAGVLLVAAVAFALLDRWRKRQLNETFSAHDQLTAFRVLYERGELSREEYERVRLQLMARLKKETVPTALPPPTADARPAPKDQPPD